MTVTNKFTLFGINVAGTLFSGVQRTRHSMGIQDIVVAADGRVDPTFAAMAQQIPTIGFSSMHVGAILNGFPSGPLSGKILTTGNVLTAYFQRVLEGGTRDSGNTAIRAVINEGLLIPRSISARLNQPAVIDIEAHATYDGTNDPIVYTQNVAISGTPAVTEAFMPGPVKINGTTIKAVESITIDFAIRIQNLFDNDEKGYWPSHLWIVERRPTIRFTTHDMAVLSSAGLSGVAQGATDSLVYLRSMERNSVPYTDASLEHIKFSIDDGRIKIDEIDASHPDGTMATVLIEPTYDGTNEMLASSVDQAIT